MILTGSFSLYLSDRFAESLTGRKWVYSLYPISFLELRDHLNTFELKDSVSNRLIWGSYPDVFSIENINDRQRYLSRLTNDYLYRDVLELASVKHPEKIHRLLVLLAFQVGSEVSLSELASNLDMSKETVERYIDLLEKSFVIFRLSGFSRNLRKEVTKNNKIYFYDLGVRNILIDNMNEVSNRNDIGQLWENFIVVERKKRNEYTHHFASSYFWRTYTGAEIDYVEEDGGTLHGFEFKYGDKKVKPPKTWMETYKSANFSLINQENFLDFLTLG